MASSPYGQNFDTTPPPKACSWRTLSGVHTGENIHTGQARPLMRYRIDLPLFRRVPESEGF